MNEIYLPVLSSFANGNVFTGSSGDLRFRAVPKLQQLENKQLDTENSTIEVEYWHGPLCYEKSTMEGKADFPLTEEGRQEITLWLQNAK